MKICDALSANGYIDLGVFHPEKSALDVAYLIANELNIQIDGDVESLTVSTTAAKPKNTYGGNYGLGTLPLHTDLAHWHIPPRFFMLRCAVADPQVFTMLPSAPIAHMCLKKVCSDSACECCPTLPRRSLPESVARISSF